MGIADLISRLRKVRQMAPGRFIACCPAHEDRSPSLTVRELPDGRILLHCFGGCDIESVLGAIGLKFSDLFPEALKHERLGPIYAAFSPMEALHCLSRESAIVAICAAQMEQGKPLDAIDTARLWDAAGRIATALEVVHGK